MSAKDYTRLELIKSIIKDPNLAYKIRVHRFIWQFKNEAFNFSSTALYGTATEGIFMSGDGTFANGQCYVSTNG